jgi:hypothetical protein
MESLIKNNHCDLYKINPEYFLCRFHLFIFCNAFSECMLLKSHGIRIKNKHHGLCVTAHAHFIFFINILKKKKHL